MEANIAELVLIGRLALCLLGFIVGQKTWDIVVRAMNSRDPV